MSRVSGNAAEEKAAQFLKEKGYKILDKNFTARFGEIDIVAQSDKSIVFVEVKMRSTSNFGLGREFVTHQKLQKIIKTAHLFLKERSLTESPFRIDVIEVQGNTLTHLENITL